MKNKKTLAAVLVLAAAVLGIVAYMVWKGASPAVEDTRTPLEKRMQDPEYLKKLDEITAERKQLVKELQILRAKIKVAQEKDPDGEEYKALKAQELEMAKKFEVHRLKATATVRDRMAKDINLNGKTKKETK